MSDYIISAPHPLLCILLKLGHCMLGPLQVAAVPLQLVYLRE